MLWPCYVFINMILVMFRKKIFSHDFWVVTCFLSITSVPNCFVSWLQMMKRKIKRCRPSPWMPFGELKPVICFKSKKESVTGWHMCCWIVEVLTILLQGGQRLTENLQVVVHHRPCLRVTLTDRGKLKAMVWVRIFNLWYKDWKAWIQGWFLRDTLGRLRSSSWY